MWKELQKELKLNEQISLSEFKVILNSLEAGFRCPPDVSVILVDSDHLLFCYLTYLNVFRVPCIVCLSHLNDDFSWKNKNLG